MYALLMSLNIISMITHAASCLAYVLSAALTLAHGTTFGENALLSPDCRI
jgi:hypothetical protein